MRFVANARQRSNVAWQGREVTGMDSLAHLQVINNKPAHVEKAQPRNLMVKVKKSAISDCYRALYRKPEPLGPVSES